MYEMLLSSCSNNIASLIIYYLTNVTSDRYDTLVSTHQHLLNREIDNQDRLEKEKANLMKFVEEKNNDIMSFNNQLANLQVIYKADC